MKGKVIDAATGQILPGANIYVSDLSGALVYPATGTTSKADGSFIIENGYRPVCVRYIGYEMQIITPEIDYAIVELKPAVYQLPTATITGNTYKWVSTAAIFSIIYYLIFIKK